MKQWYILLFVLYIFTHCRGQVPIAVPKATNPTTATQPNPHSPKDIVHSAIRDQNGSLWFCTSGAKGLIRYNGTTFTNITEAEGLCNNRVSAILEDHDGTLWLATEQGICIYDGTSFTNFRIPGDTVIAIGNVTQNAKWMHMAPTIHCMMEDKAGNIWFGTEFGVYRYDPKLADPEAAQEGKVDYPAFTHFLPQEVVSCMLEDKAGTIWLGSWSQGGLYRYEGNQADLNSPMQGNQPSPNSPKHTTASPTNPPGFIRQNGPSDGMISCIYQDHQGILWVGTRDHGLCRYDPSKAKRQRANAPHSTNKAWTDIGEHDGLCSDNVSCIMEDGAGNLWIGGSGKSGIRPGGICRYDGKTFTPFSRGEGLQNNDIFCCVQDNAGNLWFGGRYGRLFRYDGKGFTDFSAQIPW